MIIDTHLHPTNLVDEAWRHTGEPFTGERMLKLMDGPYMINGKPRRIDMGFIQPPPGNTGYRDGNRKGRDGIRDYMAYCAELCQNTRTASSATSTTTRAGGLKTAQRSWNSMSRNTASRCLSCTPTCTAIAPTARSIGCVQQ